MTDDADENARAARAKKGCPFLNNEQAAFYLDLSPRKLRALRQDGSGPRFRRHARYVRYHIDDLDHWSRNSGERSADTITGTTESHNVETRNA